MATQSLWRHGASRRVWSGCTISAVGDQITGLAVPWLVLRLTHSPGQLEIVLGLRNLPFLLFALSSNASRRYLAGQSRRRLNSHEGWPTAVHWPEQRSQRLSRSPITHRSN